LDKAVAVCVDPQHVGKVWHRVDHFIRSAIERVGIDSFNDIVDDVICGASLLWLAWDGDIIGAAVTHIEGPVCTIVAYGGKRVDHLVETLENYARDERCETMRVLGRKGWIRVLKEYHQPYVVLERKL